MRDDGETMERHVAHARSQSTGPEEFPRFTKSAAAARTDAELENGLGLKFLDCPIRG